MRTLDLPSPWCLPIPADAGSWWSAVGRRLGTGLSLRHAAVVRGFHRRRDPPATLVYFVGGPLDGRLEWIPDADPAARLPWPAVESGYRLAPALPTAVAVATCLDTD